MKERVNIQFSIEIDELDIEVQRLIKKALTEIQHIVDECNSIEQAAPLIVRNCDVIDNIRQKMAKADFIFADIVNIINGYLGYKSGSATSASANPIEDVEQLKSKLDAFKQSLEAEQSSNENAP